MERSRLTEQLDILLQELRQLERIIVVLDGNRYTDTWSYTERTLDELSQCMERLCITYDSLTHFYPNLDINTRYHVTSMQTILRNLIQRTVELVEQCEEIYMAMKVILLLKTPQTTVLKNLDVQEK